MDVSISLDPFFKPQSIAIVGLSRRALQSPVNILSNLRDFGYAGKVYVINPNLPPLAGAEVFPDLDSIRRSVDLVVVTVPRSAVLGVIRDCLRNGIRAAIVITQGLADADEEGRKLQEEIVNLKQGSPLRILGPNTMGVVNAFSGFTSSFFEVFREKIPIGIISQSGLFMLGYQEIKNIQAGFGMAADLGNTCDISFPEMLEYFGQEENIKVIQMHVETLAGGAEFLKIAPRVSRQKPIIALKSGKSLLGRQAAASHSGAAAGDHEIYQAVFQKAGVIAAEDCEDLRLLSRAFLTYVPPAGTRVAVMTFSGAAGILALDALEEAGLGLATFSEATRKALQGLFPSWMEIKNPLDIWMAVSAGDFAAVYPRILETLLQDENVDAVFCIYLSFSLPKHEHFNASGPIRQLASRYPQKPIFCWTYGPNIPAFTEEIEKDGRAMVFPSLRSAARALKRLHVYGLFQSASPEEEAPVRSLRDEGRIQLLLQKAQGQGKKYLFVEGLEIMKCCGFAVARWAVVRDLPEIEGIEGQLAYPVVLKIISPQIVHKSDHGGVRMDVQNTGELKKAFGEMMAEARNKIPGALLEGVLVQEKMPAGKEIMIGVKKDPNLGHCLLVGAGGIYTEALHDYSFGMAPLSEGEALRMIEEIKYFKILKGVRGEPPADIPFIANMLARVSQFLMDYPEVAELDINPLIVYPRGGSIVDARMVLE